MALRCNLCYMLVALLILIHCEVLLGNRILSKQELVTHKTIKTDYGDVYDCVDFYKQSAFDHPLLKNHSFHPEMRPTLKPKEMKAHYHLLPNVKEIELGSLRLKDGGCPQGMVPIRRKGKVDHNVDLKFLSKSHSHQKATLLVTPNVVPHQRDAYFAIAQTQTKVYYGVGAVISVFNPRLIEEYSQYSSGEISIQRGSDSITVGWTVNPYMYRDNRTRFFVYTTLGGKGCFNGECGFISVRPDLPPDSILSPISRRGGPIYTIDIVVFKDKRNGNWWLTVSNTTIGFWPPQVFKDGLADSGSYVSCGGEVLFPNHPGVLVGPEMGSGVMPYYKVEYNAFCSWFSVANDKDELVDVEDVERYANKPDSYQVWDAKKDPQFGHLVLFGGPLQL